jgi:hypothetical protein
MNANDFDLELQELERLSTVKLLALDRLDPLAFVSLKQYLCGKAELLRKEYVVSKQILGAIRGAASAIRNHVEFTPNESEHLSLANEFEMLLDLMIRGEGCSDRQSGVPRVL